MLYGSYGIFPTALKKLFPFRHPRASTLKENRVVFTGNTLSSVQLGVVLRQIQRLTSPKVDDEPWDQLLLKRYTQQRDNAAFAALLERRGPMVL
jgi:hypothetical protein